MTTSQSLSKSSSSEEVEILQEIERLSQKLSHRFDPLKSYVSKTQVEYTSFASFQTPQDTLENTSDKAISFEKSPTESFAQQITPLSTQEQRYEIKKTLGEGGMGLVHLVYDHLLNREVAQKQIKLQSSVSGSFSEKQKQMLWRLNQEASITAMLEHPNIVPLYEMQQKASGEIQFTMRKIEGRSLRELLYRIRSGEERYEERRLLSIFLKVCDAIAYAHSKGVVHRDLKPENIMVGAFGEVYVMDWGIAKRINTQNEEANQKLSSFGESGYRTRGGIGTPGYMAPEQIEQASTITCQADIYSLGKLLRECFTLMSPLEELNQALQAKSQKNTRKEIALKNSITRDTEAIIQKASENEPIKRYQTVTELSSDLEKYLQNLRVSVREYGFLELFQKFVKRNKKSLVLISVSIGAILLALLIFQRIQYQQHLKKNQERLSYWLEKLQNPEKRDKQRALLEINKMKEPEIFNELIQLTQEGTNYYLLSKSRNTKSDEYYKTIVEMLGWLENPKAGKHLILELEKMKEKLLTYDIETRPISDEHYMLTIAESFVNSKNFGYLLDFYNIRAEMGGNSIFCKETELLFNELFKLSGTEEILDNLSFSTIEDYKILAILKKESGDLDSAIEAYNKALCINDKDFIIYQQRGDLKKTKGNLNSALEDYNITIKINPNNATLYNNRGVIKKDLGLFDEALEDYSKAIQIDQRFSDAYSNRGLVKLKKGELGEAITDFNIAIALNSKSINSYLNRATAKFEKGDLDGALEDFKQVIVLNPKNSKAYFGLGLVQIRKNDLDSAILSFNQAISMDPKDSEALMNRGYTKCLKGDSEGAIYDYSESIIINPKNSAAYNNRAISRKKIKDLEGALKDYNKAIEINSEYDEAYTNRGLLKKDIGNLDEGIEDCSKAIIINSKNFNAYNTRGVIKLSKKEFTNAIEDFNKAIEINPNEANAFSNRAVANKEKGFFDEALKDYNSAINLNSRVAESYIGRGVVNWKKGELDLAIEDYNLAIALDSKSSDAYNNRAVIKNEKEDFKGSIEDCNKAIFFNPNNYNAYNTRGISKVKEGDFDTALEDFNMAIKINPQYFEAFQSRGVLREKQNKLEEALKDFNHVISLNPKIKEAFNRIITIKIQQKKFDEAVQYCDKLIQTDPKDSNSYYNRGVTKSEKGDLKNAIEDYTQAILLNSMFKEAYLNRAVSMELKGDFESAIKDYDQAIHIDPKYADAYFCRGNVRTAKKEYISALEDYNQAIFFNPKNIKFYLKRGEIYRLQNNFDKAIEDIDKAIDLDPKFSQAYVSRGAIKILKSDIEEAIEDFNKAIALDPNTFEAYFNRGYIFLKKGFFELAVEDLEKSITLNPIILDNIKKPTFQELLIDTIKVAYRKKSFSEAKGLLLFFRKHMPDSFENQKLGKNLEKIEEILKKSEKK